MKLNYHKSHRGGGQSQALHNVSFFNNCPDPSLWNSQVGRREFLGKIGKASVGTAIVLNGLKLEVMASDSNPDTNIIWEDYSFCIAAIFETDSVYSTEQAAASFLEGILEETAPLQTGATKEGDSGEQCTVGMIHATSVSVVNGAQVNIQFVGQAPHIKAVLTLSPGTYRFTYWQGGP